MNGREMAHAARVSERQLYRWVKRGWLRPSRVDVGYWTGEELYFSPAEQQVAQLMGALVRAGMYPDAAHKLVRGNRSRLIALLTVLETVRRLSEPGGAGLGSCAGAGLTEPCD